LIVTLFFATAQIKKSQDSFNKIVTVRRNKMLTVGTIAPDFTLPNQEGEEVHLADYRGQWVVLYFYPKDNTSGCTREAIDFTEHLGEYKKLNAQIFGISPDSVESHHKFIKKHNLKVDLLADPEHTVL
jgi:peroxiredoxin Q/BCP